MVDENLEQNIQPIIWQAKEFQPPKRDTRWYIVVVTVLIMVIAIALYYSQWLIAAVALMIGLVLFLSNKMIARQMNYRIDNQGVTINEHLMEYTNLKGFWLITVENKIYLNLISTTRLAPVITTEVKQELAQSIKEALGKNIPELDQNSEDWIDRVNRFLKV